MKTVNGESEILNKIHKVANKMVEKALISRPESAKAFLSNSQKHIAQTKIIYEKLIKKVKNLRHLTHEVENLLDNYYIISGTVAELLNSRVEKSFKKLVLQEKKAKAFVPRVYSILGDLLKTSDYIVNREILMEFLAVYQIRSPLSIRELSFVSYILRTLLVEKITEVMYQAISSLDEFGDAEYWFNQIVKKEGKKSENDYSKITSALASKYGVIPANLGFYLLQKLSQYGPDTRPIVKWLKLNLLKQGIDISDLAEIEQVRQNNISTQISNIIESLRWINQMRWDDFIIDANTVDLTLKKDPLKAYAVMDQGSQNTYRNEVVKIGDQAGVHELEVAKLAIKLCQNDKHVGYYLVGPGREELEKKIGYQRTFSEQIKVFILKQATAIHFSVIFLINILLTIIWLIFFPTLSHHPMAFISLAVLAFILNTDIAINLMNILISSLIPVRPLFRLDLSGGVSLEQATFVVIPSMLRDKKTIAELLHRLEVNYLGNNSDNIYYALLMDFRDSKTETTTTDESLVEEINKGLEALNNKYPSRIKKFYLFHRRRLWNPHENTFMGWERKRGKLREFNLLLRRSARPTTFYQELPSDLPFIKYVLTIDEDTRLPKDSAIKLIGCLDHPLNRPVIDEKLGRVISGYGIIQPRMTAKFKVARATAFSRHFSSAMGIDSYSGPVADVYQDLFGNSIFYGKGIYDVDAIEATIGDRLPENQILSHDLLEGLYTRVGFATDIFLFEGFPESYKEFGLRMHRWIRGDWQIISWLRSPIFSFSDKWKIFDNLRRSLIPVLAIFFLLISYLFYNELYVYSFVYILLTVGSSFIIAFLFRLFEWPREMTLMMKVHNVLEDLDSLLIQVAYRFVFLFDQAIISLRAITVSLYRSLISHKKMLLWQNSHEVSVNLKGTRREFFYLMSPTITLSLLSILLLIQIGGNFYQYLTLILWLASPLVAHQASQKEKVFQYLPKDIKLLRNIACRSARFFLEFSRREGNHLIPDHYQEEPTTNSPAATSPTNIGMHLLSNLSAYDFGYLSFSALREHLLEAFQSLSSLERYKGHFFNWYDVRTLQALNPKYVSSVDSANLLMAFLTLKQGLLNILDKPILADKTIQGLCDVLAVLVDDAYFIMKQADLSKTERHSAKSIYNQAQTCLKKLQDSPTDYTIDRMIKTFDYFIDSNEKIKKIVSNLNLGLDRGPLSSIYSSVDHFNALLKQQTEEINVFIPFYQARRTQPAVRNLNENPDFAKVFRRLLEKLNIAPSINNLNGPLRIEIENLNFISHLHASSLENGDKENLENWYKNVLTNVTLAESRAIKSRGEYLYLVSLCEKFFTEADFKFLYNKERGLFHIGYNTQFNKIDNSYYDFLASEANSVSFVSIIKGDAPLKHWFYLGRRLVRLDYKTVTISSWGGSLFEYLTSHIFFKAHDKSLLGESAQVSINSHIQYAQKYGVPWGIGESAHATLDLNSNYQYQIFGHPDLGFRRDLKDYLVAAPYTTLMSLSFKPKQALKNIRSLIRENLLGRYGFYDAIDYTEKLKDQANSKGTVAKIYYAHHQGFSLQALSNELNQDRIRSLFMSDPRVEALDTLLEEKVPSTAPIKPIKNLERLPVGHLTRIEESSGARQFIPIYTSYPRRALISNGRYAVSISNTGAGSSKVKDLCLTRFREDNTAEPLGQYIYLYDQTKNYLWSPTTTPTNVSTGKNKIEFFENKVCYNKVLKEIESSLTVTVAPDADVEIRSLVLTNHSKEKREIEITSYGEVSLSKLNDDIHHPAFEKLFIKSEYLSKQNALIYSKHNKEKRGEKIYFAHKLFTSSSEKLESIHTTDRAEFIGRGDSTKVPKIISQSHYRPHSKLGYNFDPIFSFQNKVSLEPNQTVTITYVNAFALSRVDLIKELKKYSNSKIINQTIKKSEQLAGEVVHNLGLSTEQALQYQGLASRLLSPQYPSVPNQYQFDSAEAGVQTLWRLSLSGDLPILIVKFYDMSDLALVKNALLCHKYLKYKGLAFDLVLLNEYPASYIKSFEDEVDFLIRYNQSPINKAVLGNVVHLRGSHLSLADKNNLLALAKIIIDSKTGTLEQQINILLQSGYHNLITNLQTTSKVTAIGRDSVPKLTNLKFYNELGGFDLSNGEYVMNINYGKSLITPTPWVNIIANEKIGFIITESGSMYSWLFDSYDNRLTKRLDDPLIDRSSEVFYLRDEETSEFWTPTPLPVQSNQTYNIRHGFGYTTIQHKGHGLDHNLSVFVPVTDGIKIIELKLTNKTKVSRKLSFLGYFETTFGGANREDNKDHQVFSRDQKGTIFIRNNYSESFKTATAFIDFNHGDCRVTNDREEFLGKNGSIVKPAGLGRDKLSDTITVDVDPCLALQNFFELAPGEEKIITILMGGSNSVEENENLINKYRQNTVVEQALAEVKDLWTERLNKIQIKTPDESLNILFNSQLLYQLISSRLLARTGYYQPSGAYGFRDQLQDSLALVWSNSSWTKSLILKAAHHQFLEGDVQNWWHDHNSFGVRTVFSDQQMWLPYVTLKYLENTDDQSILAETIPYLKGPLLDFENNPNWAGVPEITTESGDLYDHCLRAIEKTFNFGRNGLPLIGLGDWNDGMNKVGERGLGESVWLGWFLFYVLERYIPIVNKRGDTDRVKKYSITARNLKKALEEKAWDGRWYKRAFFDNGTALGSRSNAEFKIDSVAQSWSVLSGGGRVERAKQAMHSVAKNLFQDDNLLLLLSPALDKSTIDPGYIKDYPPGVRENGAQYNHAALWAAQAFAEINEPDLAMKVLDSVNPIKRSLDKNKANLYRVEPYVVASDIYAKPVEAGRGGWTWYTGSAGVMYRTILENILGFKVTGDKLEIKPCIPKDWPVFEAVYLYKTTKYIITVFNGASRTIQLVDDGKTHRIEIKP
ncbi:MAG: glucoamylase family protein [Candidatus Paceibacterota bacterium]